LSAEIDFRELLKEPRKLFGYSYIYFLIVLVGLGVTYVSNLTVIGKNSVPALVLKDSSAFVLDIPFQSPAVLPPVDVMKVGVATPELIQKGKELFRANCASCHGENGEGDGPAGAVLNPKPRIFHSTAGWTNGSKVSQMYKTLQEGIVKNGMASYSYLPPGDRFALIHFVRAFASGHPADTREELQGLETTYQLSKGSIVAGQIPIKKAAQLVLSENAPAVAAIEQLAGQAEIATRGSGVGLLDRVAWDRKKILSAFIHNRPELPDFDQFVRVVSSDPVELGFRAEVVQLSAAEWSSLYQHIRELRTRGGVI
jgi:hypothetical protein